MQLTRFVRAFGLFLVLGVGGSEFGCGSGPQQGALAKEDGAEMDIQKKGLRTFHKQLRESAKTNSADRKSGRSRARSGS